MENDGMTFQEFFATRLKEKGVSVKKLSDMTGIAPAHIENLLHGHFESMSAPYLRGYLIRLGKALDFNGEGWWDKLKNGGIHNSGKLDTLPRNRFLRQSSAKFFWALGIIILVLIYLVFQTPRILGRPALAVTFPAQDYFTATQNIFTIQGTVRNADSLTLNGDPINIGPNGAWTKNVLLQNGVNTFEITAQKFLGSQATLVEHILYAAPLQTPSSSASSTPSSTPQVHFQQNQPATGTFYE